MPITPEKKQQLQEVEKKLQEQLREVRKARRAVVGLPDAGDRHRERMAKRSRDATASVADIGEIPPVKNVRRRASCRLNLLKFLRTYFPNSTGLSPFSDDHKRVIARIKQCILGGGRFVNAVYRGFAKSTISENAALWALLYGHRKFVAIFGADATAASGNIDSIKLELAENDLLAEDFPEVCHAVQALEGKPQRCGSQTHGGALTHIEWTADKIVLPTIAGSVASGSVIVTRGIEGGSRGLKHKTPAGHNRRPDFIILDDPQTDESAGSSLQVNKRLAVVRKNLLKMSGHQSGLAIVVNATVIQRNDMVDQLLNPKLNPSWQGERIPLIRNWSDAHETLWKEYERLRNDYAADVVGSQKEAHTRATAFYVANREEMDAGCVVSWAHCFDRETEKSAIQHAYNSLIDDGLEAFSSEMQQSPIDVDQEKSRGLATVESICGKLNNIPRGVVPVECETLTAFIDVQQDCLFWLVAAWGRTFDGSVVDYGTFPDQGREHFALVDIRRTLSERFPGRGLEGCLYAGLDELTQHLACREWPRHGTGVARVARVMIDANWGQSTDVVYKLCRQSPHAAIILPSHGRGITAGNLPISLWHPKPGERKGRNWVLTRGDGARGIRHVTFDANFWKSFIQSRISTAIGDKGSLSFCGSDPRSHRLLAEHLTAEYRVQTEGRGRIVDEWKLRPERPDNHWLDCLVGTAVAASIEGASLPEWGAEEKRQVKAAQTRVNLRSHDGRSFFVTNRKDG